MNGVAPVYQTEILFAPLSAENSKPRVQPEGGVCICCSGDLGIKPVGRGRFCSNKCDARYRSRGGVPDIKKTCPRCGILFLKKKLDAVFCSEACRRISASRRNKPLKNYPEITCCICGCKAKPRMLSQRTCSNQECKREIGRIRIRNRRKDKTAKSHAEKLKSIHCFQCGEEFTPKTLRKDSKFCSDECRRDSRNIRRRKPDRTTGCVVCGSEFRAFSKFSKCCSKKCREKHARNLFKTRRTASSIQIRISNSLRGRIAKAMNSQSLRKATSTMKLLGCDWGTFMNHIQSMWLPGMNWENWGYYGWHIDHIVPCSAFDLRVESEQRQCFNYKNLQPLWRVENMKKSNRLDFTPAGCLNTRQSR